MRLQQELVLEQARFKDVKIELSEEDPKITLGIRARLTTQVAEAFGCRELIYVNETPRSGVDKMTLEGEEIDAEIRIENDNFSFTATANSIGSYLAKFEGTGPVLQFKAKLTGYAGIVTDVAERVKIDPVTITLKPAQMDLKLVEKNTGCIACNNDIPLQPNDATLHVSGTPCTRPPDAAESQKPEGSDAAPAPVAESGRKRRRSGRQASPEEIAAEQSAAGAQMMGDPEAESDFLSDIGVPEVVN